MLVHCRPPSRGSDPMAGRAGNRRRGARSGRSRGRARPERWGASVRNPYGIGAFPRCRARAAAPGGQSKGPAGPGICAEGSNAARSGPAPMSWRLRHGALVVLFYAAVAAGYTYPLVLRLSTTVLRGGAGDYQMETSIV